MEKHEAVAAHVDNCEQCVRSLSQLGNPGDAKFRLLRGCDLRLAIFDDPQFRECEARAKQIHLPSFETAKQLDTEAGEPSRSLFPSRLGDYELLEVIGCGGMGVVYRAQRLGTQKHVALKALTSRRSGDVHSMRRFYAEAQGMGKFDHPQVVRALDAGESDGIVFLVMELIDGIDVARLLEEEGTLRVADACEITRQAAVGMDYIHRHGGVHRDIKPSNLMLTTDGVVKILDLGLLRFLTADTDLGEQTATGVLLGTPAYMAPEQRADPRLANVQSDIYSLGCTLHKMLFGTTPFRNEHPADEHADAHADGTTAQQGRFQRPDVPESLEHILFRMVAEHPPDRFQTLAEVIRSLTPFCESVGLRGLARIKSGRIAGHLDRANRAGHLLSHPTFDVAGKIGKLGRELRERSARRAPSIRGGVAVGVVLLIAVASWFLPGRSSWNWLAQQNVAQPNIVLPSRSTNELNEIEYPRAETLLLRAAGFSTPAFDLHVEFSCGDLKQWTASTQIGIFYTYRHTTGSGKDVATYRTISLGKGMSPSDSNFVIRHSEWTAQRAQPSHAIGREICSVSIEPPHETNTLRVKSDARGRLQVFWNDALLPLDDDKPMPPEVGRLGLYQREKVGGFKRLVVNGRELRLKD